MIPEFVLVIIMSTSEAKYMDVIPMQDKASCLWNEKRMNAFMDKWYWGTHAICIITKSETPKVEK